MNLVLFILKLVSETSNLNNLVIFAGKLKSKDSFELCASHRFKKCPYFYSYLSIKAVKRGNNVDGNNILGHPVLYYMVYNNKQSYLFHILRFVNLCFINK